MKEIPTILTDKPWELKSPIQSPFISQKLIVPQNLVVQHPNVKKEKTMHKFLSDNGFPEFPNASFRKEGAAIYTTIFGPDFSGATGKVVRQHVAWDRSKGVKMVVHTPFDLEKIEGFLNDDFGYMTVLYPLGGDFTIRIAHMNPETDIAPEVMKLINQNKPVPNGTFLGKVGNFSKTFKNLGAHTHTEIVSIGETSAICEEALTLKFGAQEHFVNGSQQLKDYLEEKYREYQEMYPAEKKPDLDSESLEELFAAYKKDYEGRNCLGIGRYSVHKIDYTDYKTKRTWYSSKDLFNF